jgi:GAF domain-containing protein
LDDADEFAVLQATNNETGTPIHSSNNRYKVDRTNLIGYVAANRKPHTAQELEEDSVLSTSSDMPNTRSEIALPMIARGRVIGVLDVKSKHPSTFNQDDVDVLQILADQIALTIESAHLLEQTQQAVTELETLYRGRVSQAWQKQIMDGPQGYHYNRVQVTQLNSAELKGFFAYNREKSGVVSDGNGHHLSLPITLRGQKIGSIALRREKDRPAWNSTEISLAEEAVNQICASLENARLLDQTRRRAERERLVTDITTKMRSTTDSQEILNIAVKELQQALNAGRVQISFPSIQERSGGDEHVES